MDLEAQDLRFSQFYKAPQLLNPAMTGVFAGSFRLNVNYRDQWSSVLGNQPFRTEHAGIDFRFKSFGNDFFGIGANAFFDDAGHGNFRQTRGNLNASYGKQIAGSPYSDQSQYLIAGAQIGMGQNSLEWSRLWFSDQYDSNGGYPDPNSPTNEPWYGEDQGSTPIFLDFNAGLLWYATLAKNSSLYFGGSLNHLNGPVISLDGGDEKLDLRWVIHAGGQIPLNANLSFLPGVMIQRQGTRGSTAFGTNFRYSNHDWKEMAFRIGAWPHFSAREEKGFHLDEWTTSLILEWKKWDIGLSYSVNTSKLKVASLSRGAFELSLTYVQPEKTRFKTKCPKL